MKLIMEFVNSLKNGWYSGKGFKADRHGNYEKALFYYELALKYSEHGIDPVLYDSMAIAFYKLNRFEEALSNSIKSIAQYNSLKSDDQKVLDRIKVLEELVEYLKVEK